CIRAWACSCPRCSPPPRWRCRACSSSRMPCVFAAIRVRRCSLARDRCNVPGRQASADTRPPMTTQTSTLLQELAGKRGEFLAFVERPVRDRALPGATLRDAVARRAERVEQLRTPAAATAWFYRVLRNATVENHRRRDRRERALGLVEAHVAPARRAGD